LWKTFRTQLKLTITLWIFIGRVKLKAIRNLIPTGIFTQQKKSDNFLQQHVLHLKLKPSIFSHGMLSAFSQEIVLRHSELINATSDVRGIHELLSE
jgi:hypothetical protein